MDATPTAAGLPDFSRYNVPKLRKYTKTEKNYQKEHQKYQITIKYTK
jgi:hypothetical protein